METSWEKLTELTRGKPFVVEQVRLREDGIAISGQFALSPLAMLTVEDQVFVTAFIRHHGSIKEMEQVFGVSYPSIKNRLHKIAQQLEYVMVNPPVSKRDVLEKIEKGEITVKEAIEELKK